MHFPSLIRAARSLTGPCLIVLLPCTSAACGPDVERIEPPLAPDEPRSPSVPPEASWDACGLDGTPRPVLARVADRELSFLGGDGEWRSAYLFVEGVDVPAEDVLLEQLEARDGFTLAHVFAVHAAGSTNEAVLADADGAIVWRMARGNASSHPTLRLGPAGWLAVEDAEGPDFLVDPTGEQHVLRGPAVAPPDAAGRVVIRTPEGRFAWGGPDGITTELEPPASAEDAATAAYAHGFDEGFLYRAAPAGSPAWFVARPGVASAEAVPGDGGSTYLAGAQEGFLLATGGVGPAATWSRFDIDAARFEPVRTLPPGPAPDAGFAFELGEDGALLATARHRDGIELWRSADVGATWSRVVVALPGEGFVVPAFVTEERAGTTLAGVRNLDSFATEFLGATVVHREEATSFELPPADAGGTLARTSLRPTGTCVLASYVAAGAAEANVDLVASPSGARRTVTTARVNGFAAAPIWVR